jgi:hypothetical protein
MVIGNHHFYVIPCLSRICLSDMVGRDFCSCSIDIGIVVSKKKTLKLRSFEQKLLNMLLGTTLGMSDCVDVDQLR